MHKLVDYICDELEELERKADKDGKLSMTEVQYLDLLAHAKKNLLKGEEMMGTSHADGPYRRSMAGEEPMMQSQARGRNARRDSMGRYASSRRGGYYMDGGASYADTVDDMVESIYKIMDDLPEGTKREAQKFVQKLEKSM